MAGRLSGKGLGRGLDALFGDDSPAKTGLGTVSGIRLTDIEPNPEQPRRQFDQDALEELAASIKANGVISPVTLRKNGDIYTIIAGERRCRAARMAGLKEIPALVLDIEQEDVYPLALIENLQREDLNPMEEAEGYKKLMADYGMTQEQAAERVGRSRSAVANSVRLLELPEEVRSFVARGELSPGHARAVLAVKDESARTGAARKMVESGMSVREAEKLVKRMSQPPKSPGGGKDIYIADLERRLTGATGRKITISHGGKKGHITLEYYGLEDLEVLCSLLEGKK